MGVSIIHSVDIENDEIEVGVNRYRAVCDCGEEFMWREEFWQADDDAWYHVDYPDGE